MRRHFPILLVLTSALVVYILIRGPAGSGFPAMGDDLPMPPESFHPEPDGVEVTVVAEGLEVIWGMEFAPDGRLFLTERPGRVRVVDAEGRLHPEPWLHLPEVADEGEGGLMGLALHPEFPGEPWVYLMYTADTDEGRVNRISRVREVDGRGGEEEILLGDLPAGVNHNGGRLRFGPDGHLYAGLGELWDRDRAQDLADPAGSILRVDATGGIPPDNPWDGSPIWAYGLRNVQGITFHPETGALFAADHGPSGEWRVPLIRHRDEINIVRRGGNYGWPLAVGAPGEPSLEDPLLLFTPAAPPGDLLFYPPGGSARPEGGGDHGESPEMPSRFSEEWAGDLFFSTLRSETLIRIRFQDPHGPSEVQRWFVDETGESVMGRLRALAVSPDGALYVGTSNRDGRGTVREGDDRVVRLVPRNPAP